MTPSEFGKLVKTKHPGAYDDIPDEVLSSKVLAKYPQYNDLVTAQEVPPTNPAEFEKMPGGTAAGGAEQGAAGYPVSTYTETPPEVGAALSGTLPNPLAGIGSLFGRGVGAISSGLNRLLMTPRSIGVTDVMAKAAPGLAEAAPQVMTAAEQGTPGLANAVGNAAKMASEPSAEPLQGLITRTAGEIPREPISPANPNTSMLQQPISEGLGTSAMDMQQVLKARNAMTGDAISNFLQGLEKTGTSVDAKKLLDPIESMYERTADGELASTGVQGEMNDALSDAVATLKNSIKDGKISWTDANRVKSMLQDSANYAAKRFEQSNEAYKQAASLIKDGIDKQAADVLGSTGGDVQTFQTLRKAYGEGKFAEQAIAGPAAREITRGGIIPRAVQYGKRFLPYAAGAGIVGEALRGIRGNQP